MSVYVTAVEQRLSPDSPDSPDSPGEGARARCWLFSDTLTEVHEFAGRLGVDPGQFRANPIAWGYRLDPNLRAKAIRRGALKLSDEQHRALLAARAARLAAATTDPNRAARSRLPIDPDGRLNPDLDPDLQSALLQLYRAGVRPLLLSVAPRTATVARTRRPAAKDLEVTTETLHLPFEHEPPCLP